jgi:hypothetical protein
MLVHISEYLEWCWEENIEVSLLDEERRTWDHGILDAGLHHWRIVTRNRVRESSKVGEKESMTGKSVPEDVKQLEKTSGDVFGFGEVGREWKRGLEVAK